VLGAIIIMDSKNTLQDSFLADYRRLVEENLILSSKLKENIQLNELTNLVKLLVFNNNNDILERAIKANDLTSVKFIIENSDIKDEKLLLLTLENKQLEISKYLIEKNIGIDLDNKSLYYAIKNGYLDIVKLILKDNAQVFNEALRMAAEYGQLDIIKYIIKECSSEFIDIHAQNDHALQWAFKNKHYETFKFLVDEANADISIIKNKALREAYIINDMDTVKYIIELKNEDTIKIKKEILNCAEKFAYKDAIEILIDNGFVLDSSCNMCLGENGETDCINILKYIDNKTLLLKWASIKGYLIIVKYLINAGADVHYDNDVALRIASANGKLEVVKYLIEEAGAYIYAQNNNALSCAVQYKRKEVFDYLIENGAIINNEYINKALSWACECGYLNIMEYLIKHNANINANEGQYLITAIEYDHLDIVKLFVKHNSIVASNKIRALNMAKGKNHTEIVEYINSL